MSVIICAVINIEISKNSLLIFMYNNTSQYSAEHYRCEECRSTKALVINKTLSAIFIMYQDSPEESITQQLQLSLL